MASDGEASCVADPNFAVICSFFDKFGKNFGLEYPDIGRLQEMLDDSQEVSKELIEFHIKLLRKTRKSVNPERWEKALIKFCHTYSNQDGWELERFGYKKARIAIKLRLLKALLEAQFDSNQKFKNEINKLSAPQLRLEPLGRDKSGFVYWCQFDEECNIRIYREDLDEETWELIATKREDIVSLINTLTDGEISTVPISEDSNSTEVEKLVIDTGQEDNPVQNAVTINPENAEKHRDLETCIQENVISNLFGDKTTHESMIQEIPKVKNRAKETISVYEVPSQRDEDENSRITPIRTNESKPKPESIEEINVVSENQINRKVFNECDTMTLNYDNSKLIDSTMKSIETSVITASSPIKSINMTERQKSNILMKNNKTTGLFSKVPIDQLASDLIKMQTEKTDHKPIGKLDKIAETLAKGQINVSINSCNELTSNQNPKNEVGGIDLSISSKNWESLNQVNDPTGFASSNIFNCKDVKDVSTSSYRINEIQQKEIDLSTKKSIIRQINYSDNSYEPLKKTMRNHAMPSNYSRKNVPFKAYGTHNSYLSENITIQDSHELSGSRTEQLGNIQSVSDIKNNHMTERSRIRNTIEVPGKKANSQGSENKCETGSSVGKAIEEPVMFIYGEGTGFDCETGNPSDEEKLNKDNEDGITSTSNAIKNYPNNKTPKPKYTLGIQNFEDLPKSQNTGRRISRWDQGGPPIITEQQKFKDINIAAEETSVDSSVSEGVNVPEQIIITTDPENKFTDQNIINDIGHNDNPVNSLDIDVKTRDKTNDFKTDDPSKNQLSGSSDSIPSDSPMISNIHNLGDRTNNESSCISVSSPKFFFGPNCIPYTPNTSLPSTELKEDCHAHELIINSSSKIVDTKVSSNINEELIFIKADSPQKNIGNIEESPNSEHSTMKIDTGDSQNVEDILVNSQFSQDPQSGEFSSKMIHRKNNDELVQINEPLDNSTSSEKNPAQVSGHDFTSVDKVELSSEDIASQSQSETAFDTERINNLMEFEEYQARELNSELDDNIRFNNAVLSNDSATSSVFNENKDGGISNLSNVSIYLMPKQESNKNKKEIEDENHPSKDYVDPVERSNQGSSKIHEIPKLNRPKQIELTAIEKNVKEVMNEKHQVSDGTITNAIVNESCSESLTVLNYVPPESKESRFDTMECYNNPIEMEKGSLNALPDICEQDQKDLIDEANKLENVADTHKMKENFDKGLRKNIAKNNDYQKLKPNRFEESKNSDVIPDVEEVTNIINESYSESLENIESAVTQKEDPLTINTEEKLQENLAHYSQQFDFNDKAGSLNPSHSDSKDKINVFDPRCVDKIENTDNWKIIGSQDTTHLEKQDVIPQSKNGSSFADNCTLSSSTTAETEPVISDQRTDSRNNNMITEHEEETEAISETSTTKMQITTKDTNPDMKFHDSDETQIRASLLEEERIDNIPIVDLRTTLELNSDTPSATENILHNTKNSSTTCQINNQDSIKGNDLIITELETAVKDVSDNTQKNLKYSEINDQELRVPKSSKLGEYCRIEDQDCPMAININDINASNTRYDALTEKNKSSCVNVSLSYDASSYNSGDTCHNIIDPQILNPLRKSEQIKNRSILILNEAQDDFDKKPAVILDKETDQSLDQNVQSSNIISKDKVSDTEGNGKSRINIETIEFVEERMKSTPESKSNQCLANTLLTENAESQKYNEDLKNMDSETAFTYNQDCSDNSEKRSEYLLQKIENIAEPTFCGNPYLGPKLDILPTIKSIATSTLDSSNVLDYNLGKPIVPNDNSSASLVNDEENPPPLLNPFEDIDSKEVDWKRDLKDDEENSLEPPKLQAEIKTDPSEFLDEFKLHKKSATHKTDCLHNLNIEPTLLEENSVKPATEIKINITLKNDSGENLERIIYEPVEDIQNIQSGIKTDPFEIKSKIKIDSSGQTFSDLKNDNIGKNLPDTEIFLNENNISSDLRKELQNDLEFTKSKEKTDCFMEQNESTDAISKIKSRKRSNNVEKLYSEEIPCSELNADETSGGKRMKLRGKRTPDIEKRKNIEKLRKVSASSEDDALKTSELPLDERVPMEFTKKESEQAFTQTKLKYKSKGRKRKGGRQKKKNIEKTTIVLNDKLKTSSLNLEINVKTNSTDEDIKKKRKKKNMILGLEIAPEIVDEISTIGNEPPIRQSRRIAQLKIKKEADKCLIEDLKNIEDEKKIKSCDKKTRKKRTHDSEDDISSVISALNTSKEMEKKDSKQKKHKRRKQKKMRSKFDEAKPWQSSSGSSSTEEDEYEEDEYDYEHEVDNSPIMKSDHEFSPESDLEKDAESEPLKRARTARKSKSDDEQLEDEYACQKCGKSDHPEWILLCDTCDKGWHCSCLRPALMLIPEGDWFCPPCQHSVLVARLQDTLRIYDELMKKHENDIVRKKRLAFVGVSLDNVIQKQKVIPESILEDDSTESGSTSMSESNSDDSCSDESEPVYQLRERRCANTYKFNEYDAMINAAIKDEVEAVQGAGNQGRGKDIATIVNAEKDQIQEKSISAEEPEEDVRSGKDSDDDYHMEDEDNKTENDNNELTIRDSRKHFIRKKHRKLNSLDISSEDDHYSDEDFKGSSFEDEEDFDEIASFSEDSYYAERKKNKHRNHPVRRSTRSRTTRYDEDFIDDSEDSDKPRRKKSKANWDNSESESSDDSWRQRKKSKYKSSHIAKTNPKVSIPEKKKKRRRIITHDSDGEGSEELTEQNSIYNRKEMAPKNANSECGFETIQTDNPEFVNSNIGENVHESLENNEEIPKEMTASQQFKGIRKKKKNALPKKQNIKRKVIYGRIINDNEIENISSARRTRGRKISYLDAMASDSEEELKKALKKTEESEDEFVINENEETIDDIEKDSDSGDVYQPKINTLKVKSKSPKIRKNKKSPKRKSSSKENTPKHRKKCTPKQTSISKSIDDYKDNQLAGNSKDNFSEAATMDDSKPDVITTNPTAETLYSMISSSEVRELNDDHIDQIMMDNEGHDNKFLEIELAETAKKQERDARKLEKARQKALEILASENVDINDIEGPKKRKRGRKSRAEILAEEMRRQSAISVVEPQLSPTSGNNSSVEISNTSIGHEENKIIVSEIPHPIENEVLMDSSVHQQVNLINPPSTDNPSIPILDPLKPKRRGRGKGKKTLALEAARAAEAAAKEGGLVGMHLDSSNEFQKIPSELSNDEILPPSNSNSISTHSKSPSIQAHSSNAQVYQPLSSNPPSSVITRMLQSQGPSVSNPIPQSFTAAAAAMGQKYFGSPDNTGSVLPEHRSNDYDLPIRARVPPTYSPASQSQLPSHFAINRSSTPGMRLRVPTPQLYHSHHPMDPSPSGGGTISISSRDRNSPLAPVPSIIPPIVRNSLAKSGPTTPPPAYARGGSEIPRFSETSQVNQRRQMPPYTNSSHVNHTLAQPSPSRTPGNFSTYHPPPSNYHYGTYSTPSPMTTTDDGVPYQRSAFSGSSEHFPTQENQPASVQSRPAHNPTPMSRPNMPISTTLVQPHSQHGSHLQNPQTVSNEPKYEEEGSGEFGGLVSYFSSQREDDLET